MSDSIFAFWRRIDQPGHDTARLERVGEGWKLEGYAAFGENGATGLRYSIELAADFVTRVGEVAGHRSGRSFRHKLDRTDGAWWPGCSSR